MSTAASPNPNNLLLLAVIGIGAYYFLTRRAVAGPVVNLTAQQQAAQQAAARQQSTLAKLGLAIQGTNLIGTLLSKINAPGSFYAGGQTQQGYLNAAAINNSDSDPSLNGSISDYATGAIDGLAVNPAGNVGAFDWTAANWLDNWQP